MAPEIAKKNIHMNILSTKSLSLPNILLLTFEAVFEVVIVCFAGFVAAKTGLLNSHNQKVLSQLNVDLFTPCLVFTKLAASLSLKKMVEIIIIPVFYVISTGISYTCSRVAAKVLHLNEPESDFVTAMAVFGNSNSLPVSVTVSLAYTLPELLVWDEIDGDTSDNIASRGILYLLIFQQLGQILRWSWGYNKLLKKRSYEELNTYMCHDIHEHNEDSYLIPRPGFVFTDDSSAESVTNVEDIINKPIETSRYNSLMDKVPWLKTILSFMNPPLYAMFVSVIVASTPSLQRLFFTPSTFMYNTVTNAISQLGSISIPLILVVLGSNLYPSADLPKPSRHHARIIIGSLLSRMVVPALVLLPLISLAVKFIKVSILDDPIFLIVAFLLTVSPPAIQLSQIIQLNDIYRREMSSVLFWGYVVLSLPVTMMIVIVSLEVLKVTA